MSQISHIVSLEAENFKRIKAIRITPRGDVIRLVGANGAGKSSVLDAIAAALGGGRAIPEMPVRKGATKAHVVVELDDLIVERHFGGKSGSTLIVKTKDGAPVRSPQALLDSLLGDLTFDPLAFSRMEPKQQAETLRKLVGIDHAKLDAARRMVYDERTIVGRERDRLKARIGPELPEQDLPETPVDVSALTSEVAGLVESRSVLARHKDRLDAAVAHRAELGRRLEELTRLIAQADHEVAKLRAVPVTTDEATLNGEIDRINRSITLAAETNQRIQKRNESRRIAAEASTAEQKYDELTRKLEVIDRRKTELIASAKMPVDGLGFDEEGVTLNGVPFSQASTAEQLRTSVAIGLAQSPKLRVMLVRDASLLDDRSMALLEAAAAQHGAQLWVERVSDASGSKIVIEDGEVAEGGGA